MSANTFSETHFLGFKNKQFVPEGEPERDRERESGKKERKEVVAVEKRPESAVSCFKCRFHRSLFQ